MSFSAENMFTAFVSAFLYERGFVPSDNCRCVPVVTGIENYARGSKNSGARIDTSANLRYNVAMIDLVETVGAALACAEGKRFAVGVSGGRDSVCLLHAILRCGIDKSRVIVVHVNHCLRAAADRDENFVRGLCEKSGVAFVSVRVDVKRAAEQCGQTVEQAARNLRYDAFYDMIKSDRADYILTAHHALDNAESVLMHLFRGAGLDGLRGIGGFDAERKLIRPFISVYPAELDAYAAENGIEYVTDETNLVPDADRNFIRLNVLPLIEQRYTGAVRAVNEFARECESAADTLDALADAENIYYDRGAVCVRSSALDGALAGRYVRRALAYFSLVDVTREQISAAVALRGKRVGAIAEAANGVKAERESSAVAFYIPRAEYGGERPLVYGSNVVDGLTFRVENTDSDPKAFVGCVADADKLDGAVVRFRRDGDIFTPFGGKPKKLKQYFTDNKVPNRIKSRTPLIARGKEILAVVGMQVSDNVRVAADTKRRVLITI